VGLMKPLGWEMVCRKSGDNDGLGLESMKHERSQIIHFR